MAFRNDAGLLMAAGVAGLATLFLPRGSAATGAEAQAASGSARTIIARVDRQRVPPAKVAEEPYRLLIRAPSVVRFEQPDGTYTITDFARRKALLVDPAKKSAQVLEGLNPPGGLPDRSFYDLFRTIAEKPIKSVPSRLIAGTEALGFVVPNPVLVGGAAGLKPPEAQTTAWVDPQTKLPLRIETVTREDGATTTEITSIVAFDRPLDPKLFDLTPPEGYQVETFGVPALRPEPAAKAKDAAAEMVVTPLVGIGPVKFGMKIDQVIGLLGVPDKILSQGKDYKVLEYYSRGFSIHTTAQRGVFTVMCYTGKFFAFRVQPFAGRTDKGIKMGANRAAIEKAYGKPTSVHEATMREVFAKAENPDKKTGQVDLTYAGLGLSFSLHDDALDSIMLRALRPAAAAPKEKAVK
jgi:hypothetical protein